MGAQEQARALNHHYIGTEHILLALLAVPEGPLFEALSELGLAYDDARPVVLANVGKGEDPSTGQIPFTPRAKKVLELALRQALRMGTNTVTPEHILLGLLEEPDGLGHRVLRDIGLDDEAIRGAVMKSLATGRRVAPNPMAMKLARGIPVPEVSAGIHVGTSVPVRRLLMAAAARALEDGRTEIEVRDIEAALARGSQDPPSASAGA